MDKERFQLLGISGHTLFVAMALSLCFFRNRVDQWGSVGEKMPGGLHRA